MPGQRGIVTEMGIEAVAHTSAIIVSYRTPGLTVSAVRSAMAAGLDAVVVDNASADDTIQRLMNLGSPHLSVLENPVNVGFGAAANRGAGAAEAQTLIFLNSDAVLSRSAAEAIVTEVDRWRGRAIVAPRLVSVDGTVQRSAGLLPAPGDQIARALGLHAIARWIGRIPIVGELLERSPMGREYATAETATELMSTNMVSGACFAIGREAFMELGGFDERFFMYFEDADLCRRAMRAGMAVRFMPDAVVEHIGGASSSEDYHFSPRHARSLRQYMEKWYGGPGATVVFMVLWLRMLAFTLSMHRDAFKARAALWAALRG